ncbi:hypothetical protein L3X38_031298 [Prunus dulcis]|uniref:TIR domain-containing protein n=1 Tax=Prunus dulcis TaxID=3755 RepID=A0AAD4VD22_PRUDU|nr:hypothetical protein L3X38_031298 [Prunus dulcis]
MAFSRGHQDYASSSNSSPSRCRHHVFLSFRGEDSLCGRRRHSLCGQRLPTFRDEEELERGEDIKPKFEKAIQISKKFQRLCVFQMVPRRAFLIFFLFLL